MNSPNYYQHIRTDIEVFLPKEFTSVLEIGCGTGRTLSWLKERYNCTQTIGVEINDQAANEAKSRVDVVKFGDIERLELGIPDCSIDLILCLDVLEHLYDPWLVLLKLNKILKKDGTLIACIPNTRNIHVSLPLLFQGKWNYTDDNLLDKTHIRFFTKKTAIELFEKNGFRVSNIYGTGFEKWSNSRIANYLTFGLFREIFEYEYIIILKK